MSEVAPKSLSDPLKNNRLACIALFLLCSFVAPAQEVRTDLTFPEFLSRLERMYGVRFNYEPEIFTGKQLPEPPEDASLETILEALASSSGLTFHRLSDSIITIERPQLRVCGYLLNKDTSEPLAGATVQAGREAVVSDARGYFDIAVPDQQAVLSFRYLGYRTLERAYGFFPMESCGRIYMVQEELLLPEIVLSGFLVRGLDKLDDGTYRIDFNAFSLLPGLVENDVLQAVQALPGISSVNETVSDINIRGGTHDQNLILWDDIKMYQSGHFFGLISMYNPQITQQVDLRKNGTRAEYSDGVSGTLSMRTSSEVNRQFKGNAGLNLIDASAYADIPLGRSSVQVAGRKALSPFIETPTYSSYYDRIAQDTELSDRPAGNEASDIEFDFYDLSLRWLFTPGDKDLVRLNFLAASNDVRFTEPAAQGPGRESNLRQGSIAAGLFYRRQWTDRFRTSLMAYNTDYMLRATNANIEQQQRFLQENSVSETGIRLTADNSIGRGSRISGGYHYTETKITDLDDVDNPVFRRSEGNLMRAHALFAEWALSSRDRSTRLQAGVRATYLEQLERFIPEPRLSFSQQFLKHFSLEVLGEFKHQYTSQTINFQNDFLGLEKRRWQLSDDNETPVLTSKQGSAGIAYSHSGWLLNGEGFYKEVQGIATQSQGFQDAYQFAVESGQYDAYGAELLVRKQFRELSAWLSYTYLRSTYSFDGLPEPEFPNNLEIRHTVSSGLTYSPNRLQVSAGVNWHSGRPYSPALGQNTDGSITFNTANSSRLPEYFRADLSARYQWELAGDMSLQLGLALWNITGRKNTLNRFYRAGPDGIPEPVDQLSLGFTPNMVLRLYFN